MVGAKPRLVLQFNCSSIGELSVSEAFQTLILSALSTRCPRSIQLLEAIAEFVGSNQNSGSSTTPEFVLVTFYENWSAAEIYDLRNSIASLPLDINADNCFIIAAVVEIIVPPTPFCPNQRWRGHGLTLFAYGSEPGGHTPGGHTNRGRRQSDSSNDFSRLNAAQKTPTGSANLRSNGAIHPLPHVTSLKKGGSAKSPKFMLNQTVVGCPFLDTSVFEGASGKNCGARGSRYYCDYWDLSQGCQGSAGIPGSSAMIGACSKICSAVPDCTAFTLDNAVDAESGRCILHGGALELEKSCFSHGGVNTAVQLLCLAVDPGTRPVVGLYQPANEGDEQLCTRSPTSGKSKKNTKKGSMGKQTSSKGEKTGSPKADAHVDAVRDVTVSGGSKLQLIATVLAASVYVIAGIVGVVSYYRRMRRLSRELANVRQHGAGVAQPDRESPNSAALSWDTDYQLLNAKSAEPHPLATRKVTYALASSGAAQAPFGRASVYAHIGKQADSTSGRPRLTTRGTTDSTLDWA